MTHTILGFLSVTLVQYAPNPVLTIEAPTLLHGSSAQNLSLKSGDQCQKVNMS